MGVSVAPAPEPARHTPPNGGMERGGGQRGPKGTACQMRSVRSLTAAARIATATAAPCVLAACHLLHDLDGHRVATLIPETTLAKALPPHTAGGRTPVVAPTCFACLCNRLGHPTKCASCACVRWVPMRTCPFHLVHPCRQLEQLVIVPPMYPTWQGNAGCKHVPYKGALTSTTSPQYTCSTEHTHIALWPVIVS